MRPTLFNTLLRIPRTRAVPQPIICSRPFSSTILSRNSTTPLPPNPKYTDGEKLIHVKLAEKLGATRLTVTDISGGCGSMYAVEIASPQFAGLSPVKQHRMVTEVLKDDIKQMHGIQIKTATA